MSWISVSASVSAWVGVCGRGRADGKAEGGCDAEVDVDVDADVDAVAVEAIHQMAVSKWRHLQDLFRPTEQQ